MTDQPRRLSLLNEAARAMAELQEPEELLDRILDLTARVFGFEACAVLLVDEATGALVIRRARGYDPEVVRSFRAHPGEGVTGQALQTGEPVVITDVSAAKEYVAGVCGAVSEVAVPLRLNSTVLGVLDAESRERQAFAPADLELLRSFAAWAAVAVHNAQGHEQLRRKTAALERQTELQELLARASAAMVSSHSLPEVLEEILALAQDALRFETCAVLLLDAAGAALELRASRGYREEVQGLRLPLDHGVTGEVVRTGEPLLITDVQQDSRYIEGVAGGRCEMAVPLKIRDEVLGVLDAEAREVGAFGAEDLRLFTIFASNVTAAVVSARLYGDLEQANGALRGYLDEMERMNEELTAYAEQISRTNRDLEQRVQELVTVHRASQTISSSLDLQETLDTILELTGDILHVSSSAIRLLDVEAEGLKIQASFQHTNGAAGADPAGADGPRLQRPLKIGDRTIGVFELGKESGVFTEEETRMLDTLASQAAVAIENAALFERAQRTYYETIRSLAEALEARDTYTRGHSERVTRYALAIGEVLGLPEEELRVIGHAGLLHDIGKIGIRDAVLHKTTPLTLKDREIIESHPIFGDSILGPIRFLAQVQHVVRHHHERFDGSGYPDGLAGEQIPLGARIVTVADAFDAMTSDRPYRQAMDRDAATAELVRGRGGQFDPRLVDVFVELLATRFADDSRPERDG